MAHMTMADNKGSYSYGLLLRQSPMTAVADLIVMAYVFMAYIGIAYIVMDYT